MEIERQSPLFTKKLLEPPISLFIIICFLTSYHKVCNFIRIGLPRNCKGKKKQSNWWLGVPGPPEIPFVLTGSYIYSKLTTGLILLHDLETANEALFMSRITLLL